MEFRIRSHVRPWQGLRLRIKLITREITFNVLPITLSCLQLLNVSIKSCRPLGRSEQSSSYYEAKPEDPIYKLSPLVLRAAYELRIFYAINDLQEDAAAKVEAENSPPDFPETTGWHSTDPVLPTESDNEGQGESEDGEDIADNDTDDEITKSETDSEESQDDGYMEAQDYESENDDHPIIEDQAVPDLSHADDNHS